MPTQRPNNDRLDPEVALGVETARLAREEERSEESFHATAPLYGAVHPVSGRWQLPLRQRGPVRGFWEHRPEDWGIVERDEAPGMAPWSKVNAARAARKGTSGLGPNTRAAARLVRDGGAGSLRPLQPPSPPRRKPSSGLAATPMGYPHPPA